MNKRIISFAFIVGLLVICLSNLAYANVFINFDPPAFPIPHESSNNHDHTLPTSDGIVTFNGCVQDDLNGRFLVDHTTAPIGGGYFLRNAVNKGEVVTITFSFDVQSVDFYWLGWTDINMYGAIYDIGENVLDSGNEVGDKTWHEIHAGGYASPIRSMAFWSTNKKGASYNTIALDDLTLNTSVPEPATIVLFALGLAGVAARKFKRSA